MQSIYEAVKVLGLGDKATLVEINRNYKALLFKWHPDRCKEDPETCKLMTQKIIQAYKIVTAYCYNHEFSFSKEDVEKSRLSDPEEFWNEKFGHDPLWGYHG